MACPLRVKFLGAGYLVTPRGNRREDIFVDAEDEQRLLEVVAQVLSRIDAEALAGCLMGDYYHFVPHTWQGNLSLLMDRIHGVYTQTCNRRH